MYVGVIMEEMQCNRGDECIRTPGVAGNWGRERDDRGSARPVNGKG